MSGDHDVERKAMFGRLVKLRIDRNRSTSDDDSDGELDLVTLMQNKCGGKVYDPSSTSRFSSTGYKIARNRGRRQSKEFEDLLIHTTTGSLNIAKKIPGFLRPKTSGPRRDPLGQQTTNSKTDSSEKRNFPEKRGLQRSVSDSSVCRLRAALRDESSGLTSSGSPSGSPPGSPPSRRDFKAKHPMSPLALPAKRIAKT